MKWIGQHIYDFISRFRNDVYLEDISTGTIASGGNLGLDSNNKIVKANTEAGELTIANATDNRVVTSLGGTDLNAEASLTFDGSTMSIGGALGIVQTDGTPGSTAFSVINLDADQVLASFTGSNTTADVVDITASSLTTGKLIDCSASTSGLQVGLLDFDITNADTGTSVTYFQSVDFNKTGITGDGESFNFKGLYIDYDDTATNHSNSTVVAHGVDIELHNNSDQGSVSQVGLDILLQGADAANSTGVIIRTPNGANDIKVQSNDTAADLFTLDTKADGETTLTTLEDGGGSTAHFNVVADGDIVLDSASGVIKTGSTTFVNNSGVVQVATQGTIDHDSLANFVAAEHVDWAGASAGTIHATNYSNTMGSGFTVSATTDSNATTITQGDDLFFAAGTGITCETTADGTVTITNTVSDTDTNTQNTTTLSFVDSSDDIILRNTTGGAGSGTDDIKIVAGSNVTLTHTDADNFTIAATDTNTNQLTEFTLTGDSGSNQTIAHGNTLDIAGGNAISTVVSATDTVTVNHDDTSSQASVDNSGSTFIQDVTLDTYGHVTGLTSAAVPTLNQDTTGQAGTVATIAGLAPNTATTQATQPNITTMTGFVTGSANQLITDDGDGTVTSEAGLTWDGDDFTISSATTNKPKVIIKGTANHAKPPMLYFIKDKGAAGSASDSPGQIIFQGDNAAEEQMTFASIITSVVSAVDTDEAAGLAINVATSNGTTSIARNTITGTGHATNNTVDVDLGYGATSTTTIAGTLTMGSTAAMTNAGLLSVAAQTNITSLGTLTNLQVDDVNINTKSIEILGDTGDTFNITTGAAGATTLTTVDAGGAAGDLSFTADGDSIFNIGDADANKLFKVNLDGATNHMLEINGEVGNHSTFRMYEMGGDSTNDYLEIGVFENAATTIGTTDAGGAGAHVSLAPDGELRLNPTTGDTVLSSSTSAKPSLQLLNANTDAVAPEFVFQKTANGADGDDLGSIFFKGDDVAGNVETYAQILGEIQESADGDEEGKLTLNVASHDAELQPGLIVASGDAEDEVDVVIGNGSTSLTTIAGTLESTGRVTIKNNDYLYFNDSDNSHATRVISSTASSNRTITLPDATGTVALNNISYHHITASFFDTLGTTAHYIPLGDSTSEVTSDLNTLTDWIAPCETTVDSIIMRMTNITATDDITFTVQKDAIGSSSTTDVEAETLNVGSTNEHDVLFFKFDSATIAKGETLKIKIQCASSMTSSTNHFVRVNLIMNWDDRYTGSSQIFTS